MNTPLLIINFIIFAIVIISFIAKNVDYLTISLLSAFLSATITGIILNIEMEVFLIHIEWKAIIFIFFMSLITIIAVDSNILEYLTVKLFQLAKGKQRIFFISLILLTTVLAATINDVVVIIILAPVVIRICHILKIRSGTYLAGMTFCVKIGSIITPFASSENIIISTHFNLTTVYFIQNFWIVSFFLLFVTIFLMDRFILKKEPVVDPQQKKFMLELINNDVLIKNKKMFYFNSVAIVIIVFLFIILPEIYLTAAISSLILILINRKFTKISLHKMLKDIEWDIIFFLISLYVIVGSILESGFGEIFNQIPFETINPLFLYFILLITISLMSAFVANTPTTLIFIPIIEELINTGFSPVILFTIFIFGIHLGGNLVPQGAAAHVTTLNIAERSGVSNLNYKRLLKIGFTLTIIQLLIILGFVYILVLLN
ncbi:MAG: SLC13 family permease [Promethearchaeota archaeon]